MNKKKVNVMIKGQRERVYVYLDPEDKKYLKEKARQNGMSLSKLLQEYIKKAENNGDILLSDI